MSAVTTILFAVLAQAAAPAAPVCNPPCGAGQVCAPNGVCYVPAPPPGYPPAQPPQQSYGYPQQGAYPQQNAYPQQGAYPQQNGYPQQGAYPQQNAYPQQGAYQQQNAYPQQGAYPSASSYQQPGYAYPPTAQVVAPVQSPYREGPRFGLFLGGLVVPGVDVTATAGGAIVTLGSQRVGFETRLYGALAFVEDDHTKTTAGVAFVHGTYWWNVYGLGFGSGLGYAGFTRKDSGGWNDSSAMVVAYVAPVMLRFGRQPTFEIGLNAGATRFISHDVRPYGYLYGGILF